MENFDTDLYLSYTRFEAYTTINTVVKKSLAEKIK